MWSEKLGGAEVVRTPYRRPASKAKLEEWASDYEERDLGDGKKPALLLKGAEDPREVEASDDPVVQKARAEALKRLDGVLPELFFTKGGEGRPRQSSPR